MTQQFIKTKPSFLEAGLPCASLSAECQRDNNALRPPQNRLHIWWARRAPTVSRAAIVAGLLPHSFQLPSNVLPPLVREPSKEDLERLPSRLQDHAEFYHSILENVKPSQLPDTHKCFLRVMGILGDARAAYQRIQLRDELCTDHPRIPFPDGWAYPHERAFALNPSTPLLSELFSTIRVGLGLGQDKAIRVLDFMAGGGTIPLEAVRYGFEVFANDLNPVAALVLKATIEYPARFGDCILTPLKQAAASVAVRVDSRLCAFFPVEPTERWWPVLEEEARRCFESNNVAQLEPAGPAVARDYLWVRILPCPKCSLKIPLSTSFLIAKEAGKPKQPLAAFPNVPAVSHGNDCSFTIVPEKNWDQLRWPAMPSGEHFDPKHTFTFRGGDAVCPRCGAVVQSEKVKQIACGLVGGLEHQPYAVCLRAPVRIRRKDGGHTIKEVWMFRPPNQADMAAIAAAAKTLEELRPVWEPLDILPREFIPEGEKTREPRNMGLISWRDLFLPRQLLVNGIILEEIRLEQQELRRTLPPDQAEAVSVYLSLMLSKVLDYNSVNTFWHTGSLATMHTFSRHDYAFRPAFCELEGSRGAWGWAISQVTGPYTLLAKLIHGESAAVDDASQDELSAESDSGEVEQSLTAEGRGEECASLGQAVGRIRKEVIVPTVTCDDAAALTLPEPGTIHLICVDPPYYGNVQYSELSNFFYVWLKRALHDWPGLEHLFREELAECNREAVANAARWRREADADQAAWKSRYETALESLKDARNPDTGRKWTKPDRERLAKERVGPEPPTATDRADKFYEDKMAAVFRRAKQLLHPAGRMVVMFNHKLTKAWRALGAALIREGFEIRTSIPIHTEAESSLNIRGLDAARSTVLLLCLPREEASQVTGNWGRVQSRVAEVARKAAARFQSQGLSGTDLYLSALGPALGEVGRHWPITGLAGQPIDLELALDEAYKTVGLFRLEQILGELTALAAFADVGEGFNAETVDKNTQVLWLWLDTFQGDVSDSDDVQKLSKALGLKKEDFKSIKQLLSIEKDIYTLKPPKEVNLGLLARNLVGKDEVSARDRKAREADVWDERTFPGFLGAAVWNAIGLMAGGEQDHRGLDALKQWLRNSGYAEDRSFRGAFAVTLHLLRQAFGKRRADDAWHEATTQAGTAWDLAIKSGRR